MTEDSDNLDDDGHDFVAYLDGELDETRSRAVEHTLSESEEARDEVHRLQRSFDLLDLLPLAKASNDFTERTLDTIHAAHGEETLAVAARPDWPVLARRGSVIAGWVVGLSLAGVLGFLTTNRWMDTESDELVRDLEVVERLNTYADAGSVEFVVKLRESGILDEFAIERERAREPGWLSELAFPGGNGEGGR